MFSDHFKKVAKMPYKALLGIAACLVFLCQLVALVLVVEGQVEKAYLRDARSNSAQMVIDDCSENLSGAAQSHCVEQVNSALNSYLINTDKPPASALSRFAGPDNANASTSNAGSFRRTSIVSQQ